MSVVKKRTGKIQYIFIFLLTAPLKSCVNKIWEATNPLQQRELWMKPTMGDRSPTFATIKKNEVDIY